MVLCWGIGRSSFDGSVRGYRLQFLFMVMRLAIGRSSFEGSVLGYWAQFFLWFCARLLGGASFSALLDSVGGVSFVASECFGELWQGEWRTPSAGACFIQRFVRFFGRCFIRRFLVLWQGEWRTPSAGARFVQRCVRSLFGACAL